MKRDIKDFFRDTECRILFLKNRGMTIIDIEYHDFLNEQHVEDELRKRIGADLPMNVKRICSPGLRERIRKSVGERCTEDEWLEALETYEG